MKTLDTFKDFVLTTVPKQYGAGSPYENHTLIGASAVAFVVALIVIQILAVLENSIENKKKQREASLGLYKVDANGKRTMLVELPAAIIEKKKKQREARESLTIFSSPIRTLVNFFFVLVRTLLWLSVTALTHPFTRFVVFPIAFLWQCGSLVPGEHQHYCALLQKYVELAVWWVGLGVLSSVGLGTGMHSGVLFLFPHVIKVCVTAYTCGNTDFDSYSDMWFRDTTAAYTCLSPNPLSPAPEVYATFFQLFMKVFLPCLLWGAGTAMGEIPPYALSRAARLAGERNAEFEDLDLDNANPDNVVDKMKVWMVTFLQKYGFWGVLAFSAYPNMMFDLCGICCGHFLMPFWTFFGATFIGKALIKVNGQAAAFIVLASPPHLTSMFSVLEGVLPASMYTKVKEGVALAYAKFGVNGTQQGGEEASEGLLKQAWGYIMFALIGWFALSCVNQFAQSYQAEQDEIEIENDLLKLKVDTKKTQ